MLANQPPLRGRVREQARSYEKPCSPTTCSGPCPRYRAQGALLHGDDCGWGRVGADLIREARRRFRPSRTRSACPCFPSNRLAGCAEALFIGWVEPWRNPCGGGDGYRFAQPILRGVVFAGGVGADSVRDPADNAGGRGQEHPHPSPLPQAGEGAVRATGVSGGGVESNRGQGPLLRRCFLEP